MRFKVIVNGKWQGGSFFSREKADAVAASLRKPGVVVAVEPKASAPPVPTGLTRDDEEDIRRAFDELRDERDAAVRRAEVAEAALGDAAKPTETKPGKPRP